MGLGCSPSDLICNNCKNDCINLGKVYQSIFPGRASPWNQITKSCDGFPLGTIMCDAGNNGHLTQLQWGGVFAGDTPIGPISNDFCQLYNINNVVCVI